MNWISFAGIMVGLIGVAIGLVGYISTKSLKSQLIREKDLIRDKVLDIKQIWVGYRDRIFNDRKTQNNDSLNTLDIKIRIEDIEGNIANLDRFAERLQKLS